MSAGHLTEQDVERLLTDGSGEARTATAAKIAAEYDAGVLSEQECKLAEEIFRLMAEDAEVRVRQALSDNLKNNSTIPHEVAVLLAQDVDSVALPVLELSKVLSDDDLLTIVRGSEQAKQIAIARRDGVSEAVSDALIDSGNEVAVTALMANETATVSEPTLLRATDAFAHSERVQTAMVRRPRLPITVSEKLLTMVSENLREELARIQKLPDDISADLILQSRERAVIVMSSEAEPHDVEALVRQMNDNGRLTPSIILRAACMGDITFMEAALATLVGASLVNARKLIHDSGLLGLKAIYDRAGLPDSHYPAIRAAVDMAEETEYDGGAFDRERYSRRMIERVLTQYGDLGVSCEADDLEYLLAKMAMLPSDVSVERDAA